MSTALARTTFETSRAAEYFSAKELQAQTGQPKENFAAVALKELVDNALDACETTGSQPIVEITVGGNTDTIRFTVADNGNGIDPHLVRKILNFQTRTSDKAVYRSPTRGAQGNALKTIIGMPHALNGTGPVVIESCGTRHSISAWIDPAGEPIVQHNMEAAFNQGGSKISLSLPREDQQFSPGWWAKAFSVFNPHALIKICENDPDINQAKCCTPENTNSYQPTVRFPGEWRKFLPSDKTSPHWYDESTLARLIFSHVAETRKGGRSLTLRDFLMQFKGLSGTNKAKQVCDQFPTISRLVDFEQFPDVVEPLLQAMQDETQAPAAGVLGVIGENHFRTRFDDWYGVRRFWYKKTQGEIGGLPFVFEAAVAETSQEGDLYTAVNFSPTFDDPLSGTQLGCPDISSYGFTGFLSRAHVSPQRSSWDTRPIRTAVALHLSCPSLQFMDRGKTRLKIPQAMAAEVAKVLWAVCKELYKEEERRKKDAAKVERHARAAEKRYEWNLKDAVFDVLPRAVNKATGNGQYPVSARTLFYQVRPLIQDYTNKELDYTYFAQTLITQYRQECGPIEQLYYDPRGILYEPHSGKAIPLGTREVDAYSFPAWLYNKILYIEKKGLWPILKAAELAERYDMAVIAAEGYATEAARTLFQPADKREGYQLFVLHDADPHGYNIARTLREETSRMRGYAVNVIDLGLMLNEALEMDLQTEEYTRRKALPENLDLTPTEREYFEGRAANRKSWICRRVELNALSAPQLVEYIERKLVEAGAFPKVIPGADELPRLAKDIFAEELQSTVSELIDRILSVSNIVGALETQFCPDLTKAEETIKTAFAKNPSISWRRALQGEFMDHLDQNEESLRESLTRSIVAGVSSFDGTSS